MIPAPAKEVKSNISSMNNSLRHAQNSSSSGMFSGWILPILLRLTGASLWSSAALYCSFRALHKPLGVTFSSSPAVFGASVAFVISQCLLAANSEFDICLLLFSASIFELAWNLDETPLSTILNGKGSFLSRSSVGSGRQLMTMEDCFLLTTMIVLAPLIWLREVGYTLLTTYEMSDSASEGDLDRRRSFTALITLLGGTSLSFMFVLLLSSFLLKTRDISQHLFSFLFYSIMVGIPAFVEYPLLWKCLKMEPFSWALRFSLGPSIASEEAKALVLMRLWATSFVLVAVISFAMQTRSTSKYQVIYRKIFHAAVVFLFSPAPFISQWPGVVLLGFAFAVAFKILVAVELGRAFHTLSKKALFPSIIWSRVCDLIDSFEEPTLSPSSSSSPSPSSPSPPHDDKLSENNGKGFVLGHLLLLLGCAMPVWLTMVAKESSRLPPSIEGALTLLSLSGIVSVGLGDAAAAIIGTIAKENGVEHRWGILFQYIYDNTFGTLDPADHDWVLQGPPVSLDDSSTSTSTPLPPTPPTPTPQDLPQDPAPPSVVELVQYRWPGHDKTVEGTLAFAVCTFVATTVIAVSSGSELTSGLLVSIIVVSFFSSLVETFVSAADNLVVPLASWMSLFMSLHFLSAVRSKGFLQGLTYLINIDSQEL
jgi:dolichol kinase